MVFFLLIFSVIIYMIGDNMKKTFKFKSSDGITDIYGVKWEVKEPKAIIQVAHGMSEFIDRYEDFAKYLNKYGIIVVGNDHIGHGNSISSMKGPMYFGADNSWNFVVDDLFTVYKKTKEEYPDVPYFMLGFSLGSFLMRSMVLNYSEGMDGVILIGTGQVLPAQAKIALTVAKIEKIIHGDKAMPNSIDNFTFAAYNKDFKPNRTKMDWLCSNEEALDIFLDDERRGEAFTVGLFRELIKVMLYSRDIKNIDNQDKKLPILLLSGEEDVVGDYTNGIKNLYNDYKKVGIKNVDMKFYPDARHDILNEKNKEEVYEDIVGWTDKILVKKKNRK